VVEERATEVKVVKGIAGHLGVVYRRIERGLAGTVVVHKAQSIRMSRVHKWPQ